MKKKLISPRVDYIETDKSDVESYYSKTKTSGKSRNEKSSPNGGRGITIITKFLLQEDGGYLLQEDGSKLYL